MLFGLVIALALCPALLFAQADKAKQEIVVVVKLEHPWFDDMKTGIAQAAKEFNVNAYMQAPAEADAAQQVALVEAAIAKGVSAISVVPDDPAALEPVLKKAQAAKIITLSHEAASEQNVSYDIEAFDNATMGRRFIDNIVKYNGPEGGYAFFVGSLTAETHMERFRAAVAYQKQKYPKLQLLTDPPLVTQENTQIAYETTLQLIKTYGSKLKAIAACSAADPVGIAKAVEEKGLIGKLFCVGSSVPSMVKPYVDNGTVKAISLWRPADAGYVQVWIARELLAGRKIVDGQTIPKFGKIRIVGHTIYGGDAGCVDWTKENESAFFF
jgi:simple sugar transport system substrate-binding protein